MLRAGFAERDITPPLGTKKVGWIIELVSDSIADPLFVRAAVFESGSNAIGFLQLDTLGAPWPQVEEIRARITRQYGFPGENVMVAATHNHAGPAVESLGEVQQDEAYVATLIAACVAVFGEALANREEAELGLGHALEWEVAHCRRVVMRDGTVRTHATFEDPNALCLESPIDPEVAVLAVRSSRNLPLGCLVNFACHPTHHGGDTVLSAGFPGVLARELKASGWPVPLYLNGALGNVHTSNPVRRGVDPGMEAVGRTLAVEVESALAGIKYTSHVRLGARAKMVSLPYREATEEQVRGTARGAQRFVSPETYDRGMPALVEKVRAEREESVQVQVLSINEVDFAGMPAEYFVEYGLRIKQEAWPRHALVVGMANGSLGYVPTREAFTRGGYETTFCGWSRFAPEAGEILADTAVALIAEAWDEP